MAAGGSKGLSFYFFPSHVQTWTHTETISLGREAERRSLLRAFDSLVESRLALWLMG